MKQVSTKLIIALLSLFAFQFTYGDDEYSGIDGAIQWAQDNGVAYNVFTTVAQYDAYASTHGLATSGDLHNAAVRQGFFQGGPGDDSLFGNGSGFTGDPGVYTLYNSDGSSIKVTFEIEQVVHPEQTIPIGSSKSVSITGGITLPITHPKTGTISPKQGSGSYTYELLNGKVSENGRKITYGTIKYTNINSQQTLVTGIDFRNSSVIELVDTGQTVSMAYGNEFMLVGPIERFTLPDWTYAYYQPEYYYVTDNSKPVGYRYTPTDIRVTIEVVPESVNLLPKINLLLQHLGRYDDAARNFLKERPALADLLYKNVVETYPITQEERELNELALEAFIGGYPFLKYPENDVNYEDDYPALTEVLEVFVPYYSKDNKMVTIISNLTGVSKSDIIEDLRWGNGPEVHIKQLGKKADGTDIHGEFKPQEPDKIFIDIDVVLAFEALSKVNNPTEEQTKQLQLFNGFITFSVLIHEYVHFADFDFDKLMENREELGLVFEQLFNNGHFEIDPNGKIVGISK